MSLGTRTGVSTLISDDAVRALVDAQFPHLADQEIGRRYTLEDHVAVRIGDHHGALFPRYAVDDALFERAADLLRPHLGRWSFPVSAPVGTGVPGEGFPYHWTLVEWISASTAAFVPLHAASARALGSAIREMPLRHDPAFAQDHGEAAGINHAAGEADGIAMFALRPGHEGEGADVDALGHGWIVPGECPAHVTLVTLS